MAKKGKAKVFDSDGVEVTAGCTISFSYGIPPVAVTAKVIERKGELIALTPGHKPAECRVRMLEHTLASSGSPWEMSTVPSPHSPAERSEHSDAAQTRKKPVNEQEAIPL